jgi:hypothetical protein
MASWRGYHSHPNLPCLFIRLPRCLAPPRGGYLLRRGLAEAEATIAILGKAIQKIPYATHQSDAAIRLISKHQKSAGGDRCS